MVILNNADRNKIKIPSLLYSLVSFKREDIAVDIVDDNISGGTFSIDSTILTFRMKSSSVPFQYFLSSLLTFSF